MEEINTRFKELRKECGKTQTEWGEILGIRASGISDIESGRRNVTEQHLIMLSNWKERCVNIDWLRTGEGSMFVELPINNVVATTARFLGKKDPTFEAIVQLYAEMSPEDREAMMKFGFYLKDKFGNHGSEEDSK